MSNKLVKILKATLGYFMSGSGGVIFLLTALGAIVFIPTVIGVPIAVAAGALMAYYGVKETRHRLKMEEEAQQAIHHQTEMIHVMNQQLSEIRKQLECENKIAQNDQKFNTKDPSILMVQNISQKFLLFKSPEADNKVIDLIKERPKLKRYKTF